MKNVSPFRELEKTQPVTVTFEGEVLSLPAGANLAASLLAAGVGSFRQTPVSGAPRGPFCMMGACFDCLVEIDGITRQACMVTVTDSMKVMRPRRDEALP